MTGVKDTTDIAASPEQIAEFFLGFQESLHARVPDRVECRYPTPGPLKENRGHGIFAGTGGILVMAPGGSMTLFVAEMHVGSNTS